jgi:hypothetical protein
MLDAVKPQGCTNLKLRQLSRAVTRHYDAYVAPTGLKNSQYSLLSHVVLLGPLRPSDLAARMKIDASTLTRDWCCWPPAGTFALTMGARQSMGLFLGNLNTATGLGLASISLAFAFGQLWWGLTQPIRRHGGRPHRCRPRAGRWACAGGAGHRADPAS